MLKCKGLELLPFGDLNMTAIAPGVAIGLKGLNHLHWEGRTPSLFVSVVGSLPYLRRALTEAR